jgi:L1 cell adhesion molecule like protein
MVSEASKYEAEDKLIMEKVEARNGAEGYLYGARNSLQEEKAKDALTAMDISSMEVTIQEGLDWLDANRESATVEEIKAEKAKWEEKMLPMMAKMYAAKNPAGGPGSGFPAGFDPNAYSGMDSAPGPGPGPVPGPSPKIEEVD